jgi:hypothetical protein
VVSSLFLLSCAKWNLVRSFQTLLVANRSEPIDVSAKPFPKYHSIGSGGTAPMLDARGIVTRRYFSLSAAPLFHPARTRRDDQRLAGQMGVPVSASAGLNVTWPPLTGE